jgi:RNase P subunit RPR2
VSDVLAWQPMTMAKNAVCASCNELLPKGSSAAIGVAEHGDSRVIVCSTCFEEGSK